MILTRKMIRTTASRLFCAMLVAMIAWGTAVPAHAADKGSKMTKRERVCLRNGNKLYEKKRYAEAEVEYRKALQANPSSEKAQFNLATALMRQGSVTAQQDDDKNPMKQAEGILTNLAKGAQDKQLRGKACYDLGNIAYGRQQYDQAVEFYKHALRCSPDDEQARHNLRLAQLKKQQQDKNQNKDKNKDNNQDKNQDKDKNQDQNKDKNQDQNKDQNKQNQDQNKQNQDKQNQQQQQGGMSQQNAEQVLKAMQDRERATQQRINAQQAQQQRHERQRTNKKW